MSGQNKKYTFDSLVIEFNTEMLNDIVKKSIKSSNCETGGILIGNYSEDRTIATITIFDQPASDSVKAPCSFIRGKNGLSEKLIKLWGNNEYYLGEWHLHPYASPSASDTDIKQIKKISEDKRYNCPEPIMLIVGGNKNKFIYNAYIVINGSVEKMEEKY